MRVLHCLVFSGLVLTGPVWARHWHEDRDQWNWQSQHADLVNLRDNQRAKDCYFPLHDVRIISDYYPSRLRLQPPSGEKSLRRNGSLPPGWESRLELLDAAVDRLLVPIPGEYRRGILDGFAVVYSPQTAEIIDATQLFGSR